MRKSFELLDWMKQHFGGSGEGGGILYRFAHGLKENDGLVTVDTGNGLSVNESTGMLEVPIGQSLTYTPQGIDAREADTGTAGVTRLAVIIDETADDEAAATPKAVKEYVDANSGGGIDWNQVNEIKGNGSIWVEMTPTQSAENGFHVKAGAKETLLRINLANPGLEFRDDKTKQEAAIEFGPSSIRLRAESAATGEALTNSLLLSVDKAQAGGHDIVTADRIADTVTTGIVKLSNEISHEHTDGTAVTPDGVAAYVESKMTPSVKQVYFRKASQYTDENAFYGVCMNNVVMGTMFMKLTSVVQSSMLLGNISPAPKTQTDIKVPVLSDAGVTFYVATVRIDTSGNVSFPNGCPSANAAVYVSYPIFYQS